MYEDLRSRDGRFLVAAGHQRPDQERVISEEPSYVVVAALAPCVAEVADPQLNVA